MTAPRGVVKTSLGVERAHVGSAIELRYRRPIATAFFATQERFTFYHGSCVGVPIPMRKPPTGEPCAGELHARFGGRGRRKSFPTLSTVFLSRLWLEEIGALLRRKRRRKGDRQSVCDFKDSHY